MGIMESITLMIFMAIVVFLLVGWLTFGFEHVMFSFERNIRSYKIALSREFADIMKENN